MAAGTEAKDIQQSEDRFGWKRWSREDIYAIFIRKQLQIDRCIGFVAKRTGKPYEGKPHVRFEVAGDGEVLWRA